MEITEHAKRRLKERFSIKRKKDINDFIVEVSRVECHKRLKGKKTLKVVSFKGYNISVVSIKKLIITVYSFDKRKKMKYRR